MSDHDVFGLGSVVLQCGITLPDVKVAYKTYGELNAARDNAVLMPSFGGQHADTELMAPGRVLDPAKLFTIVPNLLRGPIVRDSGAWAPASARAKQEPTRRTQGRLHVVRSEGKLGHR
jgi:homoserine O-acetyltransferase